MKHEQWGDVHFIHEFITPEDMAVVREYIDNSTFQRQEGVPNSYIEGLEDPTNSIIADAQKLLQQSMEKDFNCVIGDENQGTIVKYDIGWTLSLHADVYDHLPTYAGYPTRDLSSILYLSEDFDGGDLWFPDLDLLIHPTAGSVAYFPSSTDFMHEVTELKAGNRYTCTSFWHILEQNS